MRALSASTARLVSHLPGLRFNLSSSLHLTGHTSRPGGGGGDRDVAAAAPPLPLPDGGSGGWGVRKKVRGDHHPSRPSRLADAGVADGKWEPPTSLPPPSNTPMPSPPNQCKSAPLCARPRGRPNHFTRIYKISFPLPRKHLHIAPTHLSALARAQTRSSIPL